MEVNAKNSVNKAFRTLGANSQGESLDIAVQTLVQHNELWKGEDLANVFESETKELVISRLKEAGKQLPSDPRLTITYSRLFNKTFYDDYADKLITQDEVKSEANICAAQIGEEGMNKLLGKINLDIKKLVIKTFNCSIDKIQLTKRLNLKYLEINESEMIKLPDLPPNLQELDISNCLRLSSISALEGLTVLERLIMKRCRRLSDLKILLSLHSLAYLDISQTPITTVQPLISLSGRLTITADGTKIPPNELTNFNHNSLNQYMI